MSGTKGKLEQLLTGFMGRHKLGPAYASTARRWFVPLAEDLYLHQKSAGATLFVGVNGTQGSGKSTLCDFLLEYLTSMYDLHVISISLDDFYLTSQIRAELAETVQPLFATRGVPGTHNVIAMQTTFEALAANDLPLSIPRFNKATDNPFPESEWLVVKKPVDIVLMEGWCWGIRAQSDDQVAIPVNGLEELEDIDASWRTYVNKTLKEEYEPLYDYMHYWVMLKAPGFNTVHDWRCEQEHKLKAKLTAEKADTDKLAGLMSDAEILRFIQHYQRLTEHGLETLAVDCDRVFHLDEQRQIVSGSWDA